MTVSPAQSVRVCLTINGRPLEFAVQPRRSLADLLRREAGLPGTRLGCEQGVCGACTVLVDGDPVRACLMLAAQADGTEVSTVEGLAPDGRLNPLQQAFTDCHGVQCGFCTAGFLMLATALLRDEPRPDRDRIRSALSANLCRCTGYTGIIDAVAQAAGRELP
ncbi:MAG: (2Fe-2S)-binding protein [Jatrophihabitantaceae bacterium]